MTQTDTNRFTLLLAGTLHPTARLRAQVAGSRIIAADAGMAHAQTLALMPELWVGDFDSADASLLEAFDQIPRKRFDPAKDTTDGALAIQEALASGATSLVLVGAFGGRTDHGFALMAQACALAQQGVEVLLTSGLEEAVPLCPKERAFDYATGTLFSVLAFSDLKGLTLKGARWPLDAISMEFGNSLTLSNRVQGHLRASLTHGTALLLARLDDKD